MSWEKEGGPARFLQICILSAAVAVCSTVPAAAGMSDSGAECTYEYAYAGGLEDGDALDGWGPADDPIPEYAEDGAPAYEYSGEDAGEGPENDDGRADSFVPSEEGGDGYTADGGSLDEQAGAASATGGTDGTWDGPLYGGTDNGGVEAGSGGWDTWDAVGYPPGDDADYADADALQLDLAEAPVESDAEGAEGLRESAEIRSDADRAEEYLPESVPSAMPPDIEDTVSEVWADGCGKGPEELFAAYADGVLCGGEWDIRAAASVRLSGLERRLVTALDEEIPKIAGGTRASTVFKFNVKDLGMEKLAFTAEELGIPAIVSDGAITPEAKSAVSRAVPISLKALHLALMQKYPCEMYWYDKTAGAKKTVTYKATYDSGLGQYVLNFSAGVLTLRFSAAPEFATGEYEVRADAGASVRAARSAALGIVGKYAGASDYDKLRGYFSEVCALTDYNNAAIRNKAAYGNPWQLIWVFDGDNSTKVVCEGYAKAFLYLCSLTEFDSPLIDCTAVSGDVIQASGTDPHMWNVVRMEDGQNYLADATIADIAGAGGKFDETYFLAGGPGSVSAEGCRIGSKRYVYDGNTLNAFSGRDIELNGISYAASFKTLGEATRVSAKDQRYTGGVLEPAVTVVHKGTALREGIDYGVSFSDNVDAGTAVVTVTGRGEYSGSASGAFMILQASITGASVEAAGAVYTGSPVRPAPSVTLNGKKLVNGRDYTAAYADNVNAGEAVLAVTGRGNYTGRAVKRFAIARAPIGKASVTGVSAKTYNGKPQVQNPSVRLGGRTLKAGTDYMLSYTNQTNAGTASVTLTGKGNYTGNIKKTFIINPASISKAKVEGVMAKTWTGNIPVQKPSVKLGVKTLKVNTDYTLLYSNWKNVGTAELTVKGRGNYKGCVKKAFAVNPKGTPVVSAAPGFKCFTVRWGKRMVQATGYQVQYTSDKSFKSGVTTKTAGNVNTVSMKATGLKAKTTYYMRVRTYKKAGGKTFCSAWSTTKSVKTK